MKGIILAGGSGTRLNPLTFVTSKQLLPVYDKPLIYYPLTTLISLGIREVLIISNPNQISSYQKLLGNGKKFGIALSYEVQSMPNGIAEALLIGEEFLDNQNCCLILGDNIFVSNIFHPSLINDFKSGAMVFSSKVQDPHRYGVVEIDDNGIVRRLVEKPASFISNDAVTGLYFYDNQASDYCKKLTPSTRGEIEITDLNNLYLKTNTLSVISLDESSAWMDAGTFSSLHDSASYIKSMQKRVGTPIGSPEYAAFKNSFISSDSLLKIISSAPENDYYALLKKTLDM